MSDVDRYKIVEAAIQKAMDDGMFVWSRVDKYGMNSGRCQVHFDEYLCKNILEVCYGLSDIVVDDRPDLRCFVNGKSVGVEVTSCAPPKYHLLWKNVNYDGEHFWLRKGLNPKTESAVDAYFPLCDDVSGVREMDMNLLDCRFAADSVAEDAKVCFNRKLAKLPSYRQETDETWLFMRCQVNMWFSEGVLDGMQRYFFSVVDGFDQVFVFDDWQLNCFRRDGRDHVFCRNDMPLVIRRTWSDIDAVLIANGF